jgi:uncharacterized protein (DUF433 family)
LTQLDFGPFGEYYSGHTNRQCPVIQPASVVHSDPEILSGTPVFVGTRVPAQALFDYLEGGETLDAFLRQFPTVTRDQALAALDIARDSLLASARSA